MHRQSNLTTEHDSAGDYEVELFDCQHPKGVIICVHGRGVRRWDGEHFFYNIADHYGDYACLLVDQNQFDGDTCKLNPLPVAVARVQQLIAIAQAKYPRTPIVIIGHSMGCGIATMLPLDAVSKVIFVAPAAGDQMQALVERYGAAIVEGKLTTSVDGLKKFMSKEYVDSLRGVVLGERYQELLSRYKQVYAFESGSEEIVGPDRFALRDMAFAGYTIIPGATHNLTGEPLGRLFVDLNQLLA